MTARVSPTERIRAEIDQLFAADRDLGEVLEDVARLGARLLLQAALELRSPPSLAASATPVVSALGPATATATSR